MSRISIVFWILVSAAFGQTKAPNQLKVWFGDGTGIDIHTESTGANAPLSTSGSETVPSGYDFHRVVFEKDGKLLLGYDLEARRSAQGAFAIRIKPIDTTQFMVGGRGKWLEIPTIAAIREFPPLRLGDAVQVDILHNPATGERIYDVLKVSGYRPAAGKASQPVSNRFSLQECRVDVEGKTVVGQQNTWMTGGGLMIYLPRRGEYYFTLSPPPHFSFRPAGWADHNVLRFHADGELIEVVSKSNVLQKTDYATVWVYHEPEPATPSARGFEFRCADDVESILPKKR